MNIEMVKLAKLKPFPGNPRIMPEGMMAALKKSLKEFGVVDPIIALPDGRVIGGNQRLDAAKAIGLKQVPVVRVDLTDTDARRLNLALNRIAGEWDPDGLGKWITELAAEDVDLSAVGFEDDDVATILADYEASQFAPQTDEDDVPEPPAEPITKMGDIWQCGRHRVMCGDSTKGEHNEFLMSGQKAVLLLTDPPYGVQYEGGAHNKKKREKLQGDDRNVYARALPMVHVTKNAAAYIWFAGTRADLLWAALDGWKPRSVIVWVKLSAHYGAFAAQYKQRHELMLYCVRGVPHWRGQPDETTVWEYPQPSRNEHHPTQKPIALMEKAIRNSSKVGDLVLDPFLGSGTTMIAAEKLGRTAYGMEIEPRYVDVSVKRWEQYTGKKAELLRN